MTEGFERIPDRTRDECGDAGPIARAAPYPADPGEFKLFRTWRDWLNAAWGILPAALLTVWAASDGNWLAAVALGCLALAGAICFAYSRVIAGWKTLYSALDSWNDILFAELLDAREHSSPRQVVQPIREVSK